MAAGHLQLENKTLFFSKCCNKHKPIGTLNHIRKNNESQPATECESCTVVNLRGLGTLTLAREEPNLNLL